MLRLSLLLLTAGLIFTACEQKTEKASPEIIAEADGTTNPTEESAAAAAQRGTTKIEFENKVHDFGRIHQGQMVSHVFKFKNAGDSPLIVMDANASCGCTVPQWTREPIQPGETGEIEVKYNGSGSGQIHKTVTVTANTNPAETILEIKANVKTIDSNNKGPFKQ